MAYEVPHTFCSTLPASRNFLIQGHFGVWTEGAGNHSLHFHQQGEQGKLDTSPLAVFNPI